MIVALWALQILSIDAVTLQESQKSSQRWMLRNRVKNALRPLKTIDGCPLLYGKLERTCVPIALNSARLGALHLKLDHNP